MRDRELHWHLNNNGDNYLWSSFYKYLQLEWLSTHFTSYLIFPYCYFVPIVKLANIRNFLYTYNLLFCC